MPSLFPALRWISLCAVCVAFLLPAAEPTGAVIYKEHCSLCHDNSTQTRAPSPAALRSTSPEVVIHSLESGIMKQQGASLSADQKRLVAEFVTDRKVGSVASQEGANMCADASAALSTSGPAWNGWGADLANTRFQAAQAAGITAADVPRLKLKWAFAFPNTFVANGQPTIVGDRIFVPSANRHVYSLNARTGCQYWSFEPQASVRTAITIATVQGTPSRTVAFFGDQRANAYAVDATNGELLWKAHVEKHPNAKIVGAPVFYESRVYVPVTAGEEGPSMSDKYECCSARGALVALDAATGKEVWKTYTIAEEPKPLSKNAAGTQMWGPSGASIWSAPTIDVEKKRIYVGTGDNFSDPGTKTSDAIIAFDLATGKMLWARQLTAEDVYNMGCAGPAKSSCPDKLGPDFDIGASPILVKLSSGKRVLLVSQKSGIAHGIDPDREGAILWQTRVGKGGALGGIQWGSASDGKNMYVAVSDVQLKATPDRKRTADPSIGGGLFALDAATGAKVWSAAPPVCGDRVNCSPAQSAAVTAIAGVVFSGSVDGHLRGYATKDGSVVWDFDTAQQFPAVNAAMVKGGSMDGPGPTIVNGMMYVDSGYGAWGGLPGNALLAFSVDGK